MIETALTILLLLLVAATLPLVLLRTGITRILRLWPALLYIVLCLLLPGMLTQWRSQLAVAAIVPLYPMLQTLRKAAHPLPQVFYMTLLLLLGSLAVPSLVLYVPLFWLMMMNQQVFSLRLWTTSLLAIAFFSVWYAVAVWVWNVPFPYFDAFRLSDFLQLSTLSTEPSALYTLGVYAVLLMLGIFFTAKNLWRIGRSSSQRRFAIFYSALTLIVALVLTLVLSTDLEPLIVYPFCFTAVLYSTRNL